MNETFFPSAEAAEPAVFCEHCQKPFIRRSGTGGKPQRFCSPACRADFHAANSQRRSPHVGDPEATAIEQPAPQILTSEAPKEWDFNWPTELIVVPAQPAIAVYFNPRGEVVIRQEGQYGYDDDHWIYVQIQNLDPLIDQLQRIARGEIVID
jgi:hypothetical protein